MQDAIGTEPAIPRLASLLADPAFASLEQWLRQRGIDPAELQAAIDQFLDQARQAAQQTPQRDQPPWERHPAATNRAQPQADGPQVASGGTAGIW